jgi:hypothetical protein
MMKDIEKRLRKLEEKKGEEKKPPAQEKKAAEDEPTALFTLGGAELFLEGKAEILFIDSQNESDPLLGSTDEPDPHLEIERLRLEPRLDVGRGLLLRAQIDFKPEEAETLLKEMVLEHDAEPLDWLASDLRVGLQDRFFRPSRPLKNYPLVGNAFWRDETASLIWRISLGREEIGGTTTQEAAAVMEVAPATDGLASLAQEKRKASGAGAGETGPGEASAASQDAPKKKAKSKSKSKKTAAAEAPQEAPEPAPPPAEERGSLLDYLGRLDLYFSLSNGAELDSNEVGFDRAAFNDIVQDDRNVVDDLSLREVGVGLGYRRISRSLGEVELLGFYINDELSDESLDFLGQELTIRDLATGAPIAGYGDSLSTIVWRYGGTVEYRLPASLLWGPSESIRPKDGLRLQGQWIAARDGDLHRTGWGAHAGYRYSFPRPLLLDRYFRNVETVVAYSDLRNDLATSPLLAGSWDRRQVLLGFLVEVSGNVNLDVEYSFQFEKTGANASASSVDNNELLVEVVVRF